LYQGFLYFIFLGWGKINPWDDMHHNLQQAMIPIVENSKCDKLNVNTTNIPVSITNKKQSEKTV